MENKYINFVLTGDKNYTIPITVAMTSILININKSRICRFFLFTTDFNENDINIILKLKNKYNFELINIDMNNYKDFFDKMDISTFKNKYISLATYYRLLMFKILPEDVDKCFYIDGDMIVDTDLSVIYDNLTEDKIASVVVEPLAMQHRKNILSHCYEIEDFKNFQKGTLKYPYFNAGFFLVNIKIANELNIFEKMLDFLNKYPNPPYADQDILNAVIGQQYSDLINYLEPSYNVFCNMDYDQPFNDAFYNEEIIKKSFKKPKIYHYAGANKPWINMEIANYYDVWWKYLKLSPYRKLKNPKDKIEMENIKNKITKILSFVFSKKTEGIYNIITIFGIKITFKKKVYKMNIDAIVWWIPIRKWRDNFRNKFPNLDLRTKIKFNNSVILWEPSRYSHGEILTGFAKYLLDLGYEVYIFCNPDRYKEKLFCRFRNKHLHFNKISEAEILDSYYNYQFKKCKLIIITTVRNVLDTKSNYEQKLELFNKDIRNKILLVDHDIKAPVDKGFIRDDIITIFKPNYKNIITNVVNPHYFGNIKITSKNKCITKFVIIGEINSNRRNHFQLIEAIEKLYKNKYSNFRFYFIGNNSENINIKPELAELIIITGRLNFEDMYNKLEEADYILPLLDPDNYEHNRYITTGTSGSFQLMYGFIKPAIIHKKFADYYNLNDKNAIVYNNSQDLYDKLIYSINIDSNKYKSLQQNLMELSNSIYEKSINNLKTLINNINYKGLK